MGSQLMLAGGIWSACILLLLLVLAAGTWLLSCLKRRELSGALPEEEAARALLRLPERQGGAEQTLYPL